MATRDGYVVGQVASLVTQGLSSKGKSEKKNEKLAALFTALPEQTTQREITSTDKSHGYCPPPGIVHESVQHEKVKTSKKRKLEADEENSDEAREVTLLKRRRKDRRDKTNDERTIFVGNLPTSITRKALKKLFRRFGDIETVRLRCAPRADLKMPKKLSIIKKEFHAERHNLAAYILFKSAEDTQKATAMNGHVVEGLHIRVDLAANEKQHDHQRSVFVGNLPFDANEEDVWKHFQDYGDVENVRLIRDRNTSVGKGFGYVLFKDKSSVALTLKFGKHKFKGRELRVQRSSAVPVKSAPNDKKKGNSKATQEDQKTPVRPKFKKPSNFSSHSFQGEKATKMLTKKPRHKPRQSRTNNVQVTNTSFTPNPKSKGSSTEVNLSRKKRLAMKAPGQKAQHKRFS